MGTTRSPHFRIIITYTWGLQVQHGQIATVQVKLCNLYTACDHTVVVYLLLNIQESDPYQHGPVWAIIQCTSPTTVVHVPQEGLWENCHSVQDVSAWLIPWHKKKIPQNFLGRHNFSSSKYFQITFACYNLLLLVYHSPLVWFPCTLQVLR